jgi:hypothetical protein
VGEAPSAVVLGCGAAQALRYVEHRRQSGRPPAWESAVQGSVPGVRQVLTVEFATCTGRTVTHQSAWALSICSSMCAGCVMTVSLYAAY